MPRQQLFGLAAATLVGTFSSLASAHDTIISNPIPPRLQWNENYGYCGEVSLISAGLYYGQYISQYDARALASPGVPENDFNSQLMLGINDQIAAAAMHLNRRKAHAGFCHLAETECVCGLPGGNRRLRQ
jgi:hypothetical protein